MGSEGYTLEFYKVPYSSTEFLDTVGLIVNLLTVKLYKLYKGVRNFTNLLPQIILQCLFPAICVLFILF